MDKNQVHKGIESLERNERIELIFRWHNAIVIERVLTIAAEDDYRFDRSLEGNLTFTCGENKVVATPAGELIEVNDERLDLEMLKPVMFGRLSRTNDMIDQLGDI